MSEPTTPQSATVQEGLIRGLRETAQFLKERGFTNCIWPTLAADRIEALTRASDPPAGDVERVDRFFMDHGMIHDRVTGKHVDTEPVEYGEGQFDTSPIQETCDLLNSLATAALAAAPAGRWRAALDDARIAIEAALAAFVFEEPTRSFLYATHDKLLALAPPSDNLMEDGK